MVKTQVTYEQLRKALISLGFEEKANGKESIVFRHTTGAILVLPRLAKNAKVSPMHLGMAQGTVKNYDIADELSFAARLLATD